MYSTPAATTRNLLIELPFSVLITILCFLIVLSGYDLWYRRQTLGPLDVGPPPSTVRLDRAILVGKNQGLS